MEAFKYLGRPLDQTDDDWPAIRRKIKQARTVWERLGKLLIQEGADTRVAEMFYREVVQAVLLFVSDTCLISSGMERKVEVTHTVFMSQITGKWARWKIDRRRETPRTEELHK